ncbi:Phenolic glucoside malonyltransferase [Actinidia chinensis var. chinensis]|uniref:Phenolic glucoside malonyltransferase n=1 Tax=Actinidia chinensis var. chinensis TaxID=1590841 RepID=A0A2R6P9Q2_ACTCC|nr:Phenolic glucoside malonyltransferase [Actinidia chinensis var. chinensis]
MAPANLVKVIDICRVAPPPPPPNSPTQMTFPLTFFDMYFLRSYPTQRVFFYDTTILSEVILPNLKHSLSLTLQQYLPLAGNLIWPTDSGKPIVQYVEGDKVSLTIAESDADFYCLSSNSFLEANQVISYVPYLCASDTKAPVMALQVTLFPKVGFSIGYVSHHGVVDGKTMSMFMHSWAFLCRKGGNSTLIPELTPLYDRTVIHYPDLESVCSNMWLKTNDPNNKSIVMQKMETSADTMFGKFQLTQANIENIKRWVEAQWKKKNQQQPSIHLSKFAITCAYTWVCLVKVRQVKSGEVHLAITVDCRARLEPPVPSTYFGNCLSGCIADADSDELVGEDGVAIAAKAIAEAIRGFGDGVLQGAKKLFPKLLSMQQDRVFNIVGSPHFAFYNMDFGFGRLRKADVIIHDASFSLSDSRDGMGGIEVGLALRKHETEAFASLFTSGLDSYRVL